MRTRDAVSADKLRGGFYSPEVIVNLCLDRARELGGDRDGIRVLEPSAGDGAFIRGLANSNWSHTVEHVEAVELLASEAQRAKEALSGSSTLPGRVVNTNVLNWYELQSSPSFDMVLANPPYVRFQFIDEADKQRAKEISSKLGVPASSVSNLWIPVFLLAISCIREGGSFSVILPTEFLTGVSARRVRTWLLNNTDHLKVDLFQPGSFPDVLQEVLVLSGVRNSKNCTCSVEFFDHNGGVRSWSHSISPDASTWTGYLLAPNQLEAYETIRTSSDVVPMGSLAKMSVSTVTGANKYFCVSSDVVREYRLEPWSVPLLSRSRQSPGLILQEEDMSQVADGSGPAWILNFAAHLPDPMESALPREYIKLGEDQGMQLRYKTRIRSPWYRVPLVSPGSLLLSKRSNNFPRLIENRCRAVTTDTIYRGDVYRTSPMKPDDLASVFHNSLTLLSAEIEGRSFGGGVLELVPSEVSALSVPVAPRASHYLNDLDSSYRRSRNFDLVAATDSVLDGLVPSLDKEMMDSVRAGRDELRQRREMRTSSKFYQ